MCDEEVNLPLSPSRSSSNPPRFQLHPSTPEKILNPKLQKRMQGESCFKCGQKGHYWSWFCPLNSPNKKPLSSSSHSPTHLSPQNIHCRCGHGFCTIKPSKTERNPGRMYYACPVKRGAQCKGYAGFIKWCDEPVDQSDLQPPLFKYPECQCGAGVCRRVRGTEQNTNAVKYYFECPKEKDHGFCGYQVSEDEVLNKTSINPIRQNMSEDKVLNNTSIAPTRKNRQRSLDEFYPNVKSHKTNSDLGDGLGEGGNFLGKEKRMRIMDNYEFLSSLVISEIPEGEDAGAQSHKHSLQPPRE